MNLPRPQELKQKLRILNVTDPFVEGGKGKIESIHATVRARVLAQGGSLEGETLQEQASVQTYEVVIRYISGVTAFQQLDWGGKRLVLDGPPINWTNANRWLVMRAHETTMHAV